MRATVDPCELGDRAAWIVAVKAYATRDALTTLRAALTPDLLVASVQNGIDFMADATVALGGRARLAAGSTTQGAIGRGANRVRPVGRGETLFGRVDPPGTSAGALVDAFTGAGLAARVVDDVQAVLWKKLVVNAAINPLGALTGRPNGAIADDPDLRALGTALADEAASVAAAEGSAVRDAWPLVEATARATAANRNSMLQDLDAGRRTEIDAISGAIVRRAATHGIPVPATRTVLRLVRARSGR